MMEAEPENPIDQMTDEQLERHALEILRRELGPHGLARFLRFARSGEGDYTSNRNKWLEGVSVHEITEQKPPRRERRS